MVHCLIFSETVSRDWQSLPQLHPGEERLTPARALQWATRRILRRWYRRSPAETEGRAAVRWCQWLSSSRLSLCILLFSFWWCHEASGSAGQWKAGRGWKVGLRGVWSLQGLQAHRQRPPCCFCQGFCLQVSGEPLVFNTDLLVH